MNINKILGLLLLLLFAVSSVNAIDLDNITFTNEEFLGAAVVTTVVKEINSTHIVVAYKTTNDAKAKICLIDGTGCGTEKVMMGTGGTQNMDIIVDTVTEQLIFISGGSNGYLKSYSYDLTTVIWGSSTFNTGSTNYVSAVQTNSTHFAIGFRDVANSNYGQLVICELDGTGCGSEINMVFTTAEYVKLIKTSTDRILWISNQGASKLGRVRSVDLTGGDISSAETINGASTSYIDMIEGSDNKLKVVYQDGGNGNSNTFANCNLDGTSCVETVWEATAYAHMKIVEDNNERLFTINTKERLYNFNLTGGDISSESTWTTDATTANSMIFTSANQILIAYQQASTSGDFAISEVFPSGAAVTINTPTEAQYLTSTTFSFNVSTDLATDLTYSLNGASNVSLGTNVTSSVSNILGTEGSNTIIVYSNLSGEITDSGLRTFTIDTITPTITNNIPSEIFSYNFLSSYFSCTDTNIASCNISINGLNKASGLNFSLINNGNLSYNITAVDLVGNSLVESGNLFVNPLANFYIYDELRLFNLSNFTLSSYTSNGTLLQIPTYDLGLGLQTLDFSKDGYVLETISFTFLDSGTFNESFNVTPSSLFVTLKDFHTSTDITSWQLTIKQNDIIINQSTVSTTLELFYSDIYNGQLEFILEKTGYQSSFYYIDFQSGSSVTETIYLLNSSASTLMPITVKDIFGTNYILNASVNLYGIKDNQELLISEQVTDNAGKVYFTLHDDFLYKLIISKDGYVTTNYIISSTEASYTFLIPEDNTNLNYEFAGFSYSIDMIDISNITYLRLRYTDQDSLINLATLSLTSPSFNGTNFSIISSTDTLLIPTVNGDSFYNAQFTVVRNSETYFFYKSFSGVSRDMNESTSSSSEFYLDDEDKTLVILVTTLISIIVGFLIFGQVGSFILTFINIISLWYLSIMTGILAIPLMLFILLMFGFFRGGDY